MVGTRMTVALLTQRKPAAMVRTVTLTVARTVKSPLFKRSAAPPPHTG